MVKLLIDTCSWKQLISKIEVSKELLQIQSWVKNKEIILLCPEVLREEWLKHRKIEIENISKSLTNHERKLRLYNIPIAESQHLNAKQLLESQVQIVDELLDLSENLQLTDNAKIKTTDHRRSRKAPFRNKLESDNDSLLIFTSLDYLKEKRQSRLYFLSDNHTDFIISNQNSKIHPDILEDYPEIEIKYFKKPFELITSLIRYENLTSIEKDVDLITLKQGGLIIQKNLPIIDQLYTYVEKRYNEISFYPLNLLKDEFPFKVQERFWSQYSLFTLYTDNDVLYNLFNSLTFSETEGILINDELYTNNVTDYKSKIEKIIKSLNYNLIFYIGDRDQNKRVEIRFSDKATCDCIRCRYYRLSFQTVLQNLNPEDGDTETDLIKKAYINYQTGNFLRSVEIFEKVSLWAEENNKHTTLFFTKYNLSKLSIFVDNYYWGNNEQTKITKRLKEIDLKAVLAKTSTSENDRLIDLLQKGVIFSECMARMQKISREIRENYYLQVEGGFSSNSDVWVLINEFASIDHFMNNNFIVYDSFAEFTDLFEIFTESVIASHAIPESQGSRLPHFDDYILKKLAFYGEPATIRKYTSRYNLKSIKYKETSPKGDTFLDICINIMSYHHETVSHSENHSDNSHHYFWNKYNRIFSNIILLFHLVDFDVSIKNTFSSKLLAALTFDQKIKVNNFIYVRLFLWRAKDDISRETKIGFVNLMLSDSKYHNEESFDLMSSLLVENQELGIPSEVFNKLTNLYFEEALNTRGLIPSSIVFFFKVANEYQKKSIKNSIENVLNEKFDYELYYKSVMYNVIEYKTFFGEFFKKSVPKKNAVSFRNTFINKDEKRFKPINMLINLCFKENIDLTQKVFDSLRSIDPYYTWLMDLNNFDYTRFNPFWILEYNTFYYNAKFSQCIPLKQALGSYLSINGNKKLHRAYFNIYSKN